MRKPRWTGLAAAICLVWLASVPAPAFAQVIFDGTLKPENDGVLPPNDSGPTEPPSYLIDQELGIVSSSGSNLLHSFLEFNLSDGERATFTGDSTIENVIARVTGGNDSLIEGVIRSEVGTANFYFVNPSGITFRNVREDDQQNKIEMPGSFFASTADALRFSGGERFTSNGMGGTSPSEIGSVSVPEAWIFLGGYGAPIEVDQTLPLGVEPGATLSLVAGDVRVRRAASVQADGGAIEVAAVGNAAVEVPLFLANWQPPDVLLGEIVVEGDSTLRTDAIIGGRIVMRGGRLVVSEASRLTSSGDAIAAVTALDLDINQSITIDDATVRASNASPSGVGGIRVRTGDLLVSNDGVLLIRTGNGDADTLEIEADRLVVDNGGSIDSRALLGSGRAADIVVSAREIELAGGGEIRARSFSSGRAGDIRIAATDFVDLAGVGSVISSASEAGSTGVGGNVTIAGSMDSSVPTGRVSVRDGAQIEAITITDAAGGNLRVVADQVEVSGSGQGGSVPSGLFARSGRSAATVGNGDAGALRIESRTLALSGAAEISARSFGSGRSGTVQVSAAESVILRGDVDGIPNLSNRTIDGDAGGVATGEPGLVVTTGRLEIRDGAAISASTIGSGDAGDIRIEADSVLISGVSGGGAEASLFSEAASAGSDAGDGGRIELIVRGDLDLDDNAVISVRTRGPGNSGRIDAQVGGDLRIEGDSVVRSLAESTGAAGDVVLDVLGSVSVASGGTITAESIGSADAGNVRVRAGASINARGGRVATSANLAAGGNVALEAVDEIRLDRTSIVASVRGREGEGDAGNVDLAARQITLNDSQILAQATLGEGGRIQIAASRFLESAESQIDASSSEGIDGVVVVRAPVTDLRGELVRLPSAIVDPAVLLRAPCAARIAGRGSFVVLGSAGAQRTPLEPSSIVMPIPEYSVETVPGSLGPWLEGPIAGNTGASAPGVTDAGCARLDGAGS